MLLIFRDSMNRMVAAPQEHADVMESIKGQPGLKIISRGTGVNSSAKEHVVPDITFKEYADALVGAYKEGKDVLLLNEAQDRRQAYAKKQQAAASKAGPSPL